MPQRARTTDRAGRVPEVIAHRGGGKEAPENTWEAVRHTVDLGLAWMETDLQVTSDGVVVLWHDETLGYVADEPTPIAQQSWDQLSNTDAGDGNPPVRLEEVLREFPDLRLNMDLKVAPVVLPALQVVRQAGALERVRFASFSGRRLATLRAQEPAALTSLGTSEVAGLVLRAEMGLAVPRGRQAWYPGAEQVDCVQVPVSQGGVPLLTRRFVATAHRFGLQVHVWTVDDPAEMLRLAEMNVDALITDVPGLALEVLSEAAKA